MASQEDSRKRQIDALHRQNKNTFLANDLNELAMSEKMATSAAYNGYNIFQNALLGMNWGRENGVVKATPHETDNEGEV